jgi:hypothetical protein
LVDAKPVHDPQWLDAVVRVASSSSSIGCMPWQSPKRCRSYILNQVHNIQPNVPAENIIAMPDATYEFDGAL